MVFLWVGVAAAAGPRILIVTDMEGVGGVNNADEQILPGQRRFEESQKLLAGEVSAAVAGAAGAGASDIVIWDGHDSSRSLSIDRIPRQAQLIQGEPTPANYYLSDRAYDAIFFIGQHAMARAKNGVLAHSQSFRVESITLNGHPVGEIGQVAAIAGYFHIPVILLAGDQAACDEVRELQPGAETVAVKRLIGKRSTLSLSHAEAQARIRAAAERAVRRIGEFRPWIIEGPVELTFRYYPEAPGTTTEALNRANRQVSARTVTYRGATVLETYEAWLGK